MRDFQLPGRSTVHSVHGMCATSQPLAALAAVDILRAGGNAVDAAVAASAVLCVVEPYNTGIGGDCFVLYAPGGRDHVIGLNGSGRAPAGATRERIAAEEGARIGFSSVHSVTIPGAVDAWARLVADHGTMGLDRLLAPAIDLAEQGFAVTPRVATDWMLLAPRLEKDPDMRALYLPGGKAPAVGTIWRSPQLARTLRAIAERGRDGFYTGGVAEQMLATLVAKGGTHAAEDFAAVQAEYVTPIRTAFRGHEVLEIPPNGQGITALMALNILSQLESGGTDLAALDPAGPDRVHLQVEAARCAYAVRDALVADSAHMPVPVETLLSDEFTARLAAMIDPARAMPGPVRLPDTHRDTVYLTVVDRDRNAVSFINSLYQGFGAALADAATGVVFQNRGAGFSLEEGHPNAIAPGKRPLHTIIPGMLVRDGRAVMPFGVMGGDYQPMGHVQVLVNMLVYGMDVQEALDFPRFHHEHGRLWVERGLPRATAEALAARGHDVAEAVLPHGGGQAIWIDWEAGTLVGGSDPRKDGQAIGY